MRYFKDIKLCQCRPIHPNSPYIASFSQNFIHEHMPPKPIVSAGSDTSIILM